jgi:hypothetical protein
VSRRQALGLVSLAAVALQFPGWLPLAAAALGLQLGAITLWDRAALRRLGSWRFWALAASVAILTGLLLAKPTGHVGPFPYSLAGLRAATLMLCRAAALFGVAVVASRHLTADHVIRGARRVGLPRLGMALGMALEALPRLVAAARDESGTLRSSDEVGGIGRLLRLEMLGTNLLLRAAALADELTTDADRAPALGQGDVPAVRSAPVGDTKGRR